MFASRNSRPSDSQDDSRAKTLDGHMQNLLWLTFVPPLFPVWYCLGYTATLVRLLPLVFFLLVDLFEQYTPNHS